MNAVPMLEQMHADPKLAKAFRDRLAPKLFAVIAAELGASMGCADCTDENGRRRSPPLEFLGGWDGVIDIQFIPPDEGPQPPAEHIAANGGSPSDR